MTRTTLAAFAYRLFLASPLALLGCTDGALGTIPGGGGDDDGAGNDDDDGADDDDGGPGDDDDATQDGLRVCADETGDWESIQDGIDGTPDGGLLLVCPGTYYENLVLDDREITIRSTDGAGVTTVDGSADGAVVRVIGSSGSGVALQDLTFRNGVFAGTGGGISCESAELHLDGVRVRENSANDGGGLGAVDCELAIGDSRFLDNVATLRGGGLWLDGGGGFVEASDVDGNSAWEGGGIGGVLTDLRIEDVAVSGNHSVADAQDWYGAQGGGGGIWLWGGDADIQGCEVSGNDALLSGGGIYILEGGGEIAGNVVSGNSIGNDGAGIFTNYSSTRIVENEITDNAAADDAGGIRIYIGQWATIEDNYVAGNSAADDGGGIKASHSQNYFIGNTVTGNSAGDAGGGMEMDNEAAAVQDCLFEGNSAGRGAGLHIQIPIASPSIVDTIFLGNAAWGDGGGIAVDESTATVELLRVQFLDNDAARGAGLFANLSNLDVRNPVVADGDATDSGGAFFLSGGSAEIRQGSLNDNDAPQGSAIRAEAAASLSVWNSIFAEHGGGGALVSVSDDSGAPDWTYNDAWDNGESPWEGMADPTGTLGNFSEDPEFTDVSVPDLTLSSDSPCVDAGKPGSFDGNGSVADLGAYGGPDAP
jgi:hypothetical protein